MSAGDVALTVAPGRMAPCVSVTRPVKRPGVICAVAGTARPPHASTTNTVPFQLMSHPRTLSYRGIREMVATRITSRYKGSLAFTNFLCSVPRLFESAAKSSHKRSLRHDDRAQIALAQQRVEG